MILGLDISTSSTGWCVLTTEGKLVDIGYIPLNKLDCLFSKADVISKFVSETNLLQDITHIFIEENLQAFRPGLSSAKTLITLARFNGIVSYVCKKEFGLLPVYLNVNSARKSLGIKMIRGKKAEKSTKEQVLDWVDSELDNYQWPNKTLKSGPRKGTVVLESGCYDMADSYVIARAGKMNI
jgi:hypothetical protein